MRMLLPLRVMPLLRCYAYMTHSLIRYALPRHDALYAVVEGARCYAYSAYVAAARYYAMMVRPL